MAVPPTPVLGHSGIQVTLAGLGVLGNRRRDRARASAANAAAARSSPTEADLIALDELLAAPVPKREAAHDWTLSCGSDPRV
jgi:hypothetical protein